MKKNILHDTNLVDIGMLHYRFNVIDTNVLWQKLYWDADSVIREDTFFVR